MYERPGTVPKDPQIRRTCLNSYTTPAEGFAEVHRTVTPPSGREAAA